MKKLTHAALLLIIALGVCSAPLCAKAQTEAVTTYETPAFTFKLINSSQTVAELSPKSAPNFDFTPGDLLAKRDTDGFHQLGDITLRLRSGVSGDWISYDTAAHRAPVRAMPVPAGAFAAADLTPTLPANCPLRILRVWTMNHGHIAMRFTLTNISDAPVQIGALGFPMVFDNILSGRSMAQAYQTCSFTDPYFGEDAGYVQVTRLNGSGPALLVVPDGHTPFEAWRPLREPMRSSQTFEGMYAWMVHSGAYTQNEWKNTTPWNPGTVETIAPGESHTYGLEFLIPSPSIPDIDKTLEADHRPVAIGIPGYVLPMDQDGKLFLKYSANVRAVSVSPADAIAIGSVHAIHGGWQALDLHGKTWGRCRLAIVYADGSVQSIDYYVIKPEAQAVADLGHFLTTKSWFDDPSDPFHRSPAPITYDNATKTQVTQDPRVWIAGLSDEGGAGSWLALAMKEFGQPKLTEVNKLEQFVDHVLWGSIQYDNGPNKYGVRRSVFYYDPKALPDYVYNPAYNWTTWSSWNKQTADDYGRGYNYPHVVAAYWAMYRVARNHPGMVKDHPWQWYLNQAYQTTRFCFSRNPDGSRKVGWVELGLMEGNVFKDLLQDLRREGWTTQADNVESLMRERAEQWSKEAYPFGSEMAWDSTGQEEVYTWCKYFGYDAKATQELNSIIGYMPTLPNWGYNGNARRYWDFLYAGAPGSTSRIERQIMHYGAGLNAIPILSAYRDNPRDFYLLQVGYGGTIGLLTNIARDGFASAAFHSDPDTLKWDDYSGDYGSNFFGHATDTATYVIDHPDFGWQSYGGNTKIIGDTVTISPRDLFRQRVDIAPLGLWLTLTSGRFQSVEINPKTHVVRIAFDPAGPYTPDARLIITQPAKIAEIGTYRPAQALTVQHGAYIAPLSLKPTWLKLIEK